MLVRHLLATGQGGSVSIAKLNKLNTRQNKIQEERFYRVMRALHESPDLSQRAIASKLGMSLGGLNYCLNALIDKGFVKLDNFQHSTHKLKYAYILTPSGLAQKMAMTGSFLKRKLDEYEALGVEIEQLTAETRFLATLETKQAADT